MDNTENKTETTLLAIKRTSLSFIRTSLAFLRTTLACLSVSFAFIKLDKNNPIDAFTIILMVIAGICFIGFIYNYIKSKLIFKNNKNNN